MDTNLTPSSKRHSSIASSLLSTALAVGAVVWAVTATAGIAAAQEPAASRVSYSDLDLSTQSGAQALLQRIHVAATVACGDQVHSPLLPRESAEHRTCVIKATDTAVARINAPMVAELHRVQPIQGGVAIAAR